MQILLARWLLTYPIIAHALNWRAIAFLRMRYDMLEPLG